MRIQPITNQQFKALKINNANNYTSKQLDITDMILAKTQLPQENYNGRSTLEMLEQDYDIDLFADFNQDKKSINLYFAEKAYLNGEVAELPRLTPVGIYDSEENVFDVIDIENSIIELEHGKGKNFFGSVATIAMAVGIVLITALSVFNIAKSKNTNKASETVTTMKNIVVDTLNKAQNDTAKFFEIIKK